MGVWHLSGLGINPGAVTVPLTYIYLLLKQASQGDENAQRFFKTSGELGQEMKGAPETLIIFTSEDVIQGELQGDIKDQWFKTQKQKTALETIKSYLVNLLSELKLDKFYNNNWLRYLYCVKVCHDDFEDCFNKIAITINALKDKEIWVNMIGGTNQINAALLSSSGFTSAVGIYYYLFQTDTKLLHPDIKKPDFRTLKIEVPPPAWHELPIFSFDMSELYKRLKELFQNQEKVNIGQIKQILKELGFPEQFIAKLRGGLLEINGEIVTKATKLDYWINIWEKLNREFAEVANFTQWKNWALNNRILNEIKPF